ncbi:MAG: hypothetical protein KGV43_02425 [Arcobacter sp.]|nr:hypothetical protein [Arcobacter sp.]
MFKNELNILKSIYNYCIENESYIKTFDFSDYDYKVKIIPSLKFLENEGYITQSACMGFSNVSLTKLGFEFCENGFTDPNFITPTIQGNNNTIVTGNSNIVHSQNSNIELPEDIKNLINTLVVELSNKDIPKQSKQEKISSFLSKLFNETTINISKVATTSLLMRLIENFS